MLGVERHFCPPLDRPGPCHGDSIDELHPDVLDRLRVVGIIQDNVCIAQEVFDAPVVDHAYQAGAGSPGTPVSGLAAKEFLRQALMPPHVAPVSKLGLAVVMGCPAPHIELNGVLNRPLGPFQ